MDNASPQKIVAAGEKVIKLLYNAPSAEEDLNTLRFREFAKCVAGRRSQFAKLPPTCAAAEMHSFRVYFQMQTWLGRVLDPLKWGWQKIENTGLILI